MNKRPKNLNERFGWCEKEHHGVYFLSEGNKCPTCNTEQRRIAKGQCCAQLFHGPGHQSKTYCQVKGHHTIHKCVYGCHEQEAEWLDMTKFTGFFDEPPELETT